MEINYTKAETLALIEQYYEKLEGRTVKASALARRESVGFYETESCVTSIYITEEMDVLGAKKQVKEMLSEEQLKELLKALFAEYDFDLTKVVLNDGLDSRWEGYGMAEHVVRSAYFKGITVNVKRKKAQRLVLKNN